MRKGSRRPGGSEGGGDSEVGTPECPVRKSAQSPPLTRLDARSVWHKVLETSVGVEIAIERGSGRWGVGGDDPTQMIGKG